MYHVLHGEYAEDTDLVGLSPRPQNSLPRTINKRNSYGDQAHPVKHVKYNHCAGRYPGAPLLEHVRPLSQHSYEVASFSDPSPPFIDLREVQRIHTDSYTYRHEASVSSPPPGRATLGSGDIQGLLVHRVEYLPYVPQGNLDFWVPIEGAARIPYWNQTVWSWNSTGSEPETKSGIVIAKVEKKYCCGLFVCQNRSCDYIARVPSSITRSQEVHCPDCSECLGPMLHKKCSATFTTKRPAIGQDYLVEFRGYHTHDKPPNVKLDYPHTLAAAKAFQNRPYATPAQLKLQAGINEVGRSYTIGDINAALADSARIGCERAEALQALEVESQPSDEEEEPDSAAVFLEQWRRIHKNAPWWIAFSGWNPEKDFVVVMKQRNIEACLSRYRVHTSDQNGYVTEERSGFFQNDPLLVTCVYVDYMSTWVPVVFSYIHTQSKESYAEHFLVLFRAISKVMPKCPDEYFAHVMDFSAAKRSGFELAFVRHMEEREGFKEACRGWKPADVSDAANDLEFKRRMSVARQSWAERAKACLIGCNLHWRRALTKARNNTRWVTISQRTYFDELASKLLTCNDQEYHETVRKIKAEFPGAIEWLDWWTENDNASMIFDSQKRMSTQFQAMTPKTLHPVRTILTRIFKACFYGRSFYGSSFTELFSLADGVSALERYAEVVATEQELCARGEKLHYGKPRNRKKVNKTEIVATAESPDAQLQQNAHRAIENSGHDSGPSPNYNTARDTKSQDAGKMLVERLETILPTRNLNDRDSESVALQAPTARKAHSPQTGELTDELVPQADPAPKAVVVDAISTRTRKKTRGKSYA